MRPGPRGLLGSLAVLTILTLAQEVSGQGVPVPETCTACHLDLEEERLRRPAELFQEDIHAERGFGCLECHGNPRTGAPPAPSEGFLGVPARTSVPAMCGRCHSDPDFMRDFDPAIRVDQVTEYHSSVHGRRLRELGDPDVATCVSCHPAHRIKPPSDPESSVYALNVAELCGSCHADETLMASRGQGADQLDLYRTSVHGRLMFEEGDVSAPTCNDCHGNHGATPPGVASVHAVCGQCHATMEEFFNENRHNGIFTEAGLPGCSTCHGHHDVIRPSDEDLREKNREVCQSCHEPGEAWTHELLVMAVLLDSLKAEERRSDSILAEAENLGMEVSQARFELEDVATALTSARASIHAFRVEPVLEEVEGGLEITDRAQARGMEALEEHGFRRRGLAASVAIILVLVAGLALKIRQIERTSSHKERQAHGS